LKTAAYRMIFLSVEISGCAVITCSSEYVYKWPINPFTNLNPVYGHTSKIVTILSTQLSVECPAKIKQSFKQELGSHLGPNFLLVFVSLILVLKTVAGAAS
jgi:hypothetical protein